MGVIKRTRSGVDAIEHALRGVHTSENDARIVRVEHHPGLIGSQAVVQVDVVEDSPLEREVIVQLPPRRRPAR